MNSGNFLSHARKIKIKQNKHSLSLVFIRCHPLSFVVTHCHLLSLVVILTRCTTRCHSLSLVFNRYHSLCRSLSLDISLLCFVINDVITRPVFSRFLDIRGNIKKKLTRKTYFSREMKNLSLRIYLAKFCQTSFL